MTRIRFRASCLPILLLVSVVSAAPDEFQDTREALLDQINAVRSAAGVHRLRLSTLLSSVAQTRAEEFARLASGASAEDLGGEAAREDTQMAAKAGYEARVISEVAAQSDGGVERVVEAWQEDKGPGARELVGASYRELGVGIVFRPEGPLYVTLFALSWEDFFRQATTALSDIESMRRAMLARLNVERAQHGLVALRRQPNLDQSAQAHADDMFARRYYSHDTPEGKNAMDRVQSAGYRARYAGENIARGQYSVDEVMDEWMKSPTHREHILSPVFNDVGFGLSFGKNPGGYEILWVQNFARPKGRERL